MSLNVVIVGHIDHGKSTLIGRLLYDSATIPDERLAEMQKLIEEYKRRFEFAYFLDSFEEELKEERTIGTTRVLFKGRDYYTVVDVPGHQEFIKNMLTGADHAQAAILVVSCVDGVQEQTRRHAFLVHILGVKEIIMGINKMDMVNYDEKVFSRTRQAVTYLLATLGYKDTLFVPISAMEGDNIYKRSQRTPWYGGPTLIEALDAIEPVPEKEKPLRYVVQDMYTVDFLKVAVGRVEAGTVRNGDQLIFQPSGVVTRVEAIKSFPREIESAQSGDSIGIVVDAAVGRGNVGGHASRNPPVAVTGFLGEVVLLDGTLSRGGEFEIKCGAKRSKCTVAKIREKISSETGEVLGTDAVEIGVNEAATVIFETEPMVVEKFAEIPELGRFILARDGRNVGAGIVLEAGA